MGKQNRALDQRVHCQVQLAVGGSTESTLKDRCRPFLLSTKGSRPGTCTVFSYGATLTRCTVETLPEMARHLALDMRRAFKLMAQAAARRHHLDLKRSQWPPTFSVPASFPPSALIVCEGPAWVPLQPGSMQRLCTSTSPYTRGSRRGARS